MRRLVGLLVVVACLWAGSALAGEAIPNLVGTWNVTDSQFHVKGKGFLGVGTTGVWKFEKQEGRVVSGTVEWDVKGKSHKGRDDFSGVVSKDGKTVYIAGHAEGLRIAEIEGPDAMTIFFVVPGVPEARAGFAELRRAK